MTQVQSEKLTLRQRIALFLFVKIWIRFRRWRRW
ncbi:hypothetical protein MJ1HA_2441 [Metallosphaera sedula]|nr:hypothetical protein MJ1HA_2441 [Metallosphaera sedula]